MPISSRSPERALAGDPWPFGQDHVIFSIKKA
jgi:hypothetical protein